MRGASLVLVVFALNVARRRVKEVFAEVRQRLGTHLHLTVDNEDVDCTKGDHVRCTEYKLRDPFHLIIIEDASHGAEVYSLKRKFNKNKAIIEASLLNVFSQHSRQDMTIYASENAEKEVGFVRRLSNEEVLAMIAKRSKKRHRSIISRSPLETNLLELSLLELRSFAETEHWGELEEYGEESLKASIHKEQLSFVLFWTNVNSISQHAFWLWSKASKVLKARYPDISFGAIACHKHSQLCDDNQLSKVDDYHTIFAYRNGKRLAWAKDMRDVNFYLDWVSILVSGNAVQLESEDELKDARKGKIAPFDDIRPAITIGIFQSESSADFEAFMKVCEILAGRYHFAYFFKNGATNTVFTVRPHEKKKREDFEGGFDAESLIQFVTQSSFPSIVHISRGFTSDILLRQPRPLALLIHSSENKISSFIDFCSKKPRHICTHIVRERCDAINDLIQQFALNKNDSPLLILIVKVRRVFI
ncbi:Uncharacterized protein R05D3.9 [Toxocara canis]|uniref:Uncharacterized protein R05D3.9 n=1 Tax=Toxocara canis TaxID=6265 RepID=A0A0B2W5L0_TOXCA|nr:Uncharacterized protein R05D3.9 [Toxocara canis]